jgi:hypothetical protein
LSPLSRELRDARGAWGGFWDEDVVMGVNGGSSDGGGRLVAEARKKYDGWFYGSLLWSRGPLRSRNGGTNVTEKEISMVKQD